MKIVIALLILNLIGLAAYHVSRVGELEGDVFVEQQLNKACTAELMWKDIQLTKSGCIASAYQATKNGFDLEENLRACE